MSAAVRAIWLVLVGAAAVSLGARGAGAIDAEFSTPIRGDSLPVSISIDEAPGGDGVELRISIPEGEGELLGVFGNVVGGTLGGSLRIEADPGVVEESRVEADGVSTLGPGNTLAPVTGWDWGVRLGPAGSRRASFALRGPGLRAADVLGATNEEWVLGVRVQATRGEEGWAKIGLSERAPISLRIESPTPGGTVASPVVDVSGAVTGVDLGGVLVNGREADFDGARFFAAGVDLTETGNQIRVTAANAYGRVSVATRVTVDVAPPELELATPAAGSLTGDEAIEVSGSVRDAGPIAVVRVNGEAAELSDGRFRARVPLALGQNRIAVEAVDAAGNRAAAERTVVRGERPAIVIEEPVHRAVIAAGALTVTGAVAGAPTPEVVVNGERALVEAGQFRATVALREGPLAVVATASNPIGEARDEIAVEGGAPPRIELRVPLTGAVIGDKVVEVEGRASGAGALRVDVNGVPTELAGGAFRLWTPLPNEGENEIVASVTGSLGTARAAVTVLRDTQPPRVVLTAPAAGTLTADEAVEITGTVEDAGRVTVTAGGREAEVEAGAFRVSVPLALGANAIAVDAVDAAGNRASSSLAVRRGQPPTVAIDDPPHGGVVRAGEVEVAGRATGSPPPAVVVNGVAAQVVEGEFRVRVRVPEGAATLAAVATNPLGEARAQAAVTGGVAPVLAIAEPAAGRLLRESPVVVRGSVSGTGTLAVDVNGVPARVFEGRFEVEVPLDEGRNELVATALNALGQTRATRAVSLDTQPPELALTAPSPGGLVLGAEAEVIGGARDASGVTAVRVNGVPAHLADGAFRAVVPLALGPNAIAIDAVDAAGNAASTRVELTRGERPSLAIESPGEGSVLGAAAVDVRVRAQGLPAPEVSVNGVAARASAGVWIARVQLDEGPNALVATASNPLGRATASTAVVLDTQPPRIELAPASRVALTEAGELEIAGSLADASPVRGLRVRGVPAELVDGRFRARVPLAPGVNAIEIEATDAAGNTASERLEVTRGERPSLAIESPAGGSLVAAPSLEVRLRASGLPAPEVVVNGVPAQAAAGGLVARVSLAEGPNALQATARNALGEASASATVVLDTRPPEVAIAAPVAGALTADAAIEVAGTVRDASAIRSLVVNGVPAALAEGAFRATVPLASGANTISVQSTDAAGNAATARVQVTRGEPPRLELAAPAEGSLVAASELEVSGRVTGLPVPDVSVNGVAARVAGGAFRVRVPLVEGSNALVAHARNPLGEASASRGVLRDSLPPELSAAAALERPITAEPAIEISGRVRDAGSAARVTVAGSPVAVVDGEFRTQVPLALGANAIGVEATDAVGNRSQSVLEITRGERPSIRIESPAEAARVRIGALEVRGEVAGLPPPEVQVNGAPAVVEDGRFRASVPLAEGRQALVASARNPLGEARAERAVVGAAPPSVTITAPVDGAIVGTTPLAVRGTLSEPGASVEVNGVPAAVVGTEFSAAVPLVEGPNEIVVSAENEIGRGSATRRSVLDTRSPAVTIDAPVAGAVVREPSVLVSGSVSDESRIRAIRIGERSLPGAPAFSDAVELAFGANRVVVTAEDAAGNVGRAEVDVRRELPELPPSPPAEPFGAPPVPLAPAAEPPPPPPPVAPAPALAPSPAPLEAPAAPAPAPPPVAPAPEVAPAPAPEIAPTPEVAPAPLAPPPEAVPPLPPAPALVVPSVPPEPGAPLRVAITATIQGSAAAQPSAVVAGTVSDPAASVVVNGVVASVSGTSWNVSIPLVEGANRITAVATRGAETATASTTVLREWVPAIPAPPLPPVPAGP